MSLSSSSPAGETNPFSGGGDCEEDSANSVRSSAGVSARCGARGAMVCCSALLPAVSRRPTCLLTRFQKQSKNLNCFSLLGVWAWGREVEQLLAQHEKMKQLYRTHAQKTARQNFQVLRTIKKKTYRRLVHYENIEYDRLEVLEERISVAADHQVH